MCMGISALYNQILFWLFIIFTVTEAVCNVFFVSLQANRQIRDLFEDLRDGHNLISLLEVLTGEQLVSNTCVLF